MLFRLLLLFGSADLLDIFCRWPSIPLGIVTLDLFTFCSPFGIKTCDYRQDLHYHKAKHKEGDKKSK